MIELVSILQPWAMCLSSITSLAVQLTVAKTLFDIVSQIFPSIEHEVIRSTRSALLNLAVDMSLRSFRFPNSKKTHST